MSRFGTTLRRKSNKPVSQPRHRRLSLESLEERRLLTVVSLIPVKDNSLIAYKASTTPYSGGADPTMYVGLEHYSLTQMRGLMDFDVAGKVPAGAKINSVTLTVWINLTYSGTPGTPPVELHKTLADWGEGTSAGTSGMPPFSRATTGDATWLQTSYNTNPALNKWTTPGGDFSPTVSGVTNFGADGTSATWSSTAQMVADVQAWLANPGANFGWLLKGDETKDSGKMIDSRESTTAAHRPTLTIDYTLAATNQPPTLNAISDPAAILENAGLQTVSLAGITAGTGETQQLQVTAASDNTALIPTPTVSYTSPNATGSISYQPVAYKYGTAHVTVTVRDAGLDGILGNADDATVARTFTVLVNQVNQPPTLGAIADPAAINENAGLQTVNFAGITAGTGDTQQLQVTAASDNTALILTPTVSYTSPNATGSISYQPVASKYGTAHVTVTVRDAGLDGILGNADDATFARTFSVVVNQVNQGNQTPTLDAISNPAAIDENAGLQTVNLTGITAGPGEAQALQVSATSDNTALIPDPTVSYTSPNATGSISYQPVASKYGTAHITVTVHDAGLDGILGNADDGTFAQTFTVVVNQVNAAPFDTPCLYDGATSTFLVRTSNSSGAADYTIGYGPPNGGWLPLAGDWNGDGSDTVGLFDPATCVFYLRDSVTTGYADHAFAYGAPGQGWIPIAGDWNGDGSTTIGLYDPAGSTFHLRNANTSGFADITLGFGVPHAGWKPLVGDWNGDGTTTIGLYDPATANLYLGNSNTGGQADSIFGYGAPGAGWSPLAGAWSAAAGTPLQAAGGAVAAQSDVPLLEAALQPVVSEAIARWAAAGVPAESLAAMQHARLLVTELMGANLGMNQGNTILIDHDAAGRGWFVDPTPGQNEEFAPQSGDAQLTAIDPRALDRIDLLTVVEHELGHVAGLDDLDATASSLMGSPLPAGIRRSAGAAEVDAILGQVGQGDWL